MQQSRQNSQDTLNFVHYPLCGWDHKALRSIENLPSRTISSGIFLKRKQKAVRKNRQNLLIEASVQTGPGSCKPDKTSAFFNSSEDSSLQEPTSTKPIHSFAMNNILIEEELPYHPKTITTISSLNRIRPQKINPHARRSQTRTISNTNSTAILRNRANTLTQHSQPKQHGERRSQHRRRYTKGRGQERGDSRQGCAKSRSQQKGKYGNSGHKQPLLIKIAQLSPKRMKKVLKCLSQLQ